MTTTQTDPSDGKVHIRKHPDAPTVAPAWCGKTGQATITSATGFHGPGGAGWGEVCKECVKAANP